MVSTDAAANNTIIGASTPSLQACQFTPLWPSWSIQLLSLGRGKPGYRANCKGCSLDLAGEFLYWFAAVTMWIE